MTYDFTHGNSTETEHHTCLFAHEGKSGVPSADAAVKICLDRQGYPQKSWSWDALSTAGDGMSPSAHRTDSNTSVASPCTCLQSYRKLALDYIDKNGFRRYWDDHAKHRTSLERKAFHQLTTTRIARAQGCLCQGQRTRRRHVLGTFAGS